MNRADEYKGIHVIYPSDMTAEEAQVYADTEIQNWQDNWPDKTLYCVDLSFDGDDVKISSRDRQPIRRVRRITGYLSNLENFSDAKAAEVKARADNGEHVR